MMTLATKTREGITKERFGRLVKEWKETRPPASSIEKMAMHHAYQQIIGLGPDAVPLILRELEFAPAQWFWALRSITGENPVDEDHRGNVNKMADDWYAWAKTNGYTW